MIAILIFGVSLAALLQFFVFYCRAVLASVRGTALSADVREVTGIRGHAIAGDDFSRIVQLVHLCPEPDSDGTRFRAVRSYFLLMSFLRDTVRNLIPAAAAWAEAERQACSYFAAVTLDRRISHSRNLMAQGVSTSF
jgi:hypothetical protein